MKLVSVGNNVVAVSMIHSFGYLLLLLIISLQTTTSGLLFVEGRQQQQQQQQQQHHPNLFKEQHQKEKQKQGLSTTSSFSSSSSLLLLRGGVSIRSSAVTKKIPTRPPKSNSKSTTSSTTTSTTISGTGTASMTVEVFNLIKNIVGVAVLSLPATIGMFSDQSTVIVPVIVYITIMGILSGYGFCTIGKVCSYVQGTSYREAWSKSIGPNTSWIPAVSSTCKTFLTCMAISMVLADTFGTLLGRTATQQRTETLLGLTISLLLPLCWMKNLASLAPFSILGVLGMAYTAIAMTIRYVDGSYSLTKLSSIESSATTTSVSSVLLNDVPTHLRPLFGTNGWKSSYQSPKVLLLLCTLSTAFMAHFNAPKFYLELYNNTIGRYNTMVALAYGASIVLMGYITVIGFLTFGKNSASVILNNYSTKDTFISASRIAVAISLLFTYPLAFQGCRDGILDLLNVPKQNRTNNVLNITTIVLLTIITILAATVKDVGFVLAVGGATLGNALSYIYPALMYYAVVQKQGRKGEGLQLSFSIASAIVGLLMGIIGTKLAISK